MPLCLPCDIWELVHAFAGGRSLLLCCRHLYDFLRHRHMRVLLTSAIAAQCTGLLVDNAARLRSLSLPGCGLRAPMASEVPWAFLQDASNLLSLRLFMADAVTASCVLQHLPYLRNLQSFHLRCYEFGKDADVQPLAQLADLPVLRHVFIHLRDDRLSSLSAVPLGLLWRCPQLQKLEICLSGCKVGDAGAVALSLLSQSTSITHLDISLAGCGIHSAGGAALFKLLALPKLQWFRLCMPANAIGDGLGRLADIEARPSLVHVELDLGGNKLTGDALRSLGALSNLPSITELALHLPANEFLAGDLDSLLSLAGMPCLAKLTLKLRSCGLTADAVGTLLQILRIPLLRSLALDLSKNALGNDARELFTDFGDAMPAALEVDLSSNRVTCDGMRDIADALLRARPKHLVCLKLCDNCTVDASCRELIEALSAHWGPNLSFLFNDAIASDD